MPKIEFLEHLYLDDIKPASFIVPIVLKLKKRLFGITRQELVIMFTLMRKNKKLSLVQFVDFMKVPVNSELSIRERIFS